jgi:arylsulfatase A
MTGILKAGDSGKTNYDRFFYWSKQHITALRMDDMKLRIKIDNKTKERAQPELYNLAEDISESNNLATQMPEVVEQMTKIMFQAEAEQLAGNDQVK